MDAYQASANTLRTVTTKELDGWIASTLQPSTAFSRQVKEIVQKICKLLKENCFEDNIRVQKTVKVSAARFGAQLTPLPPPFPLSHAPADPGAGSGAEQAGSLSLQGGSAGKGTALKNSSDADVVLFLNCLPSYQEQNNNRKAILDLIMMRLKACKESLQFPVSIGEPRYKGPESMPHSLRLTLSSRETRESIDVDILPAYDALGKCCQLAQGQAMVSVLGWLSPSFSPHRAGDPGCPTKCRSVCEAPACLQPPWGVFPLLH